MISMRLVLIGRISVTRAASGESFEDSPQIALGLVGALPDLAGQQTEATQLFERLLALRNDVGLLSEEWDPHTGRQLGNTPQAFSHFPLVTSALQLHAGRAHHSNHPITPPG
jgi:hypothetical protein